ncbi:hypothetical protein GGR58DRAFT_414080 [Xylaria digitata]|nr:hypothetical protein GGR58DRAFT_414080 [Xylaria digitata]
MTCLLVLWLSPLPPPYNSHLIELLDDKASQPLRKLKRPKRLRENPHLAGCRCPLNTQSTDRRISVAKAARLDHIYMAPELVYDESRLSRGRLVRSQVYYDIPDAEPQIHPESYDVRFDAHDLLMRMVVFGFVGIVGIVVAN